MPKVTVKLPEEFYKKIARLENETGRIITAGLDAGGEIMENEVRGNLKSVIGKGTKYPSRSTGELERCLGHAPVKRDSRNGIYDTKVGFHEPDKRRRINAKIANVLEHGRHGQPPKPFLAPAIKTGKRKCVKVIKDTLSEEFNKIL